MPYIQFNDQQVPLGAGDLTVGTYDGASLRLPGEAPTGRAILRLAADGTGIVVRGSADAVVLVNGVQLGAEPSPILHGDKLEIGGHALKYGDDQKGGSTQFISALDIPEHLKAKAGAPKKATGATGGRVVSQVDGREYAISADGVSFGREVGNDIVVASTDVSRKHASIAPADGGYVLTDHSTNGVYVNGSRIDKTQKLGRGDLIKIGPEEYRFYADAAPSSEVTEPKTVPTPAAAPAPPADPFEIGKIDLEDAIMAAASPVAPPAPAAPPAVPAKPASAPTPAAAPAPKPAGAALATLEVINEGPLKGKTFEIHSALTNIGRGPHNDIVIADESLSGSHAKIMKRDGAWWVADQGSTNGTYVGGRRIQGEQQLVGAPDVRFGGMKMTFRPAAGAAIEDGSGTRAIAAVNVDAARKMASKSTSPVAAAPAQLPAEKKKGCAAMIAFIVTLAAAGATTLTILFSLRG